MRSLPVRDRLFPRFRKSMLTVVHVNASDEALCLFEAEQCNMFLHPAARPSGLAPSAVSREYDVVTVLFFNLYTYIANDTQLSVAQRDYATQRLWSRTQDERASQNLWSAENQDLRHTQRRTDHGQRTHRQSRHTVEIKIPDPAGIRTRVGRQGY